MPPSSRDDHLLRTVEQVQATLRRLLGLRREEKWDEALALLQDAYGQVLGPLYGLAPRLDSGTAAQMIGHPERVRLWAELLAEEAAVRRSRGDAEQGRLLERRALELAMEAVQRDPRQAGHVRELVERLSPEAEDGLAPPYGEMLREVRMSAPAPPS